MVVYRRFVTYQRGWATISAVTAGLPGDAQRVECTFATGPAHAVTLGSTFALCDPTLQVVDSTVREGWPPSLGEVCPDCLSRASDG